jgi:rhamnose transport system ATP-binding protein
MVGRELTDVFPKRIVPLGEVVLELRRLTSLSAGISEVSLAVRRGEILGIAGLVGSGRTELAETIFGLRHRDSGEIRVADMPLDIRSPAAAIAHGIAYVPEDRSRHGVIADMSIAANASLASLGAVSRAGFVDYQAEDGHAEQHVKQLHIKTSSVLAPVASLSGGNQQKVALARWLSIEPRILILDEPTHGVDIGAKAEIHDIIGALAERGVAIVMISSELPEILGLSDRIAVMRQGAVVGVLQRSEASPQKILALAAIGGDGVQDTLSA